MLIRLAVALLITLLPLEEVLAPNQRRHGNTPDIDAPTGLVIDGHQRESQAATPTSKGGRNRQRLWATPITASGSAMGSAQLLYHPLGSPIFPSLQHLQKLQLEGG